MERWFFFFSCWWIHSKFIDIWYSDGCWIHLIYKFSWILWDWTMVPPDIPRRMLSSDAQFWLSVLKLVYVSFRLSHSWENSRGWWFWQSHCLLCYVIVCVRVKIQLVICLTHTHTHTRTNSCWSIQMQCLYSAYSDVLQAVIFTLVSVFCVCKKGKTLCTGTYSIFAVYDNILVWLWIIQSQLLTLT